RTVRVDPVANQSGTAQVTLTVSDANGGTATRSFTLTVTPVNDLPTISAIGSPTIEEDETTGAIPFTVGDIETAAGALTLQATSSNTGLLPVNRIEFGGGGANRTVRVDPVANQSGTAQVTLTVSDANGGTATRSFTLTVTPVNDLPTISSIGSQTIEEDETTGAIPFTVGDLETSAGALTVQATSSNTGLLPVNRIEFGGGGANRTVRVDPVANQSGTAQVTLTVRDADGGRASTSFTLTVTSGNDLPTISSIGSQTIEEDETTGVIPFTVGDLETSAAALTVQATSSNTGLLPVNRIEFGGSGASRTVRVDPVANQSGTAQVTVTVRDANGGSASTSFTLTVTPVNDLPTISTIGSQSVDEGETVGPIPFSVGDVETSASALTVRATTSNPGLVPVSRITIVGSGADRTVTVVPLPTRSGTVQVTLTVTDANSGVASTTFAVVVDEVNDLPTITSVATQSVDEDGTVGPIPFTVGDIETAASALTVRATTSNVNLVPVSRIVITGSGSDRTVTITPTANQFGTADVTLTVTDEEGGTASRTFTLTVNPVNDLPTISSIGAQAIDVDGTAGPILFTVGDVETAANALTVSASSSNTGLIPVSNIVLSGSGATRRVTVRPTAKVAGAAQVTLTVSDSTGGTSDSRFIVTVGDVNPILVENSLPGTPVREWNPDSSVPTIRGFTDEVSVNKGGAVTFYIQTPDAAGVTYDLVVYRLGYYQGLGAREVARFTGVSVDQPTCLESPTPSLDPATDATVFPRLIDCGNWNPTWTWNTPTNLVSGLFMARVERRDTRISCGIFFVVRDDTRNSDILLQTCDTSWQAYNYGPAYYGGSIPAKRTMDGHSVHDFFNPRAYKVSYRRPHLWALTNMAPPHTEIVGDNTVGAVLSYGEEYPLIRFLEANGFDVAYTTGRDSDRRGELIRNHRMFMTSGHDEYWSLRQRQHIQAARDAGVNLAFFSGNTAYWKIRWEDDHHTMVVYKERLGLKLDPLPGVTTGSFRDETFGPPRYDGAAPENELNGLLTTQTSFVERSLRVPEADGKLRFWRNTSVASLLPGQAATFDGLLGYQLDGDVDNGFRPSGLFHLSTTEVTDQEDSDYELGNSTIPHHMSLYRAASGALVFHAGTMRLQRALAGYYNQAPAPPDARLQQAIVNLFADMGVQPAGLQAGLKVATRSTDLTAPTARVIDPRGGSCAKIEDTVVVSGSAADVGGRVAAVEVSTDGGQSWHPASGRESWTYSFTPCNAGLYSIRARAVDDSGNIGPASSSRVLNVGIPGSVDYVINGSFDCGFEELPDVGRNARLGLGWFYRSASGAGLSLNQGGLISGWNLQRVVARGVGDGIGQHLTLAPGREYTFVARVFVESGRVAVKFGRGDEATDILTRTTDTGSWQTVRATYVPVQSECTFMITSDRGPATFKVDDVVLTSRSDEDSFTSSLSALPGGLFQLEILGEPGSTCCIETSTNLLDWDFLFLANPTSGRTVYPVPAAPRIPMRFFRAETP
ncbi:MAG: tandem-95 repeat protein, partial [Verrucomicrobiales bacterium]|nr:tandem-95 repeat protein [Verrucomicrobiales bacterium]